MIEGGKLDRRMKRERGCDESPGMGRKGGQDRSDEEEKTSWKKRGEGGKGLLRGVGEVREKKI